MANAYQKHLSELLKDKDKNYQICTYIENCCKEIALGKFKLSKKAAKHLTIDSIIDMSVRCKSALKYIPDYGTNDVRGLLIDWLLDIKLDREYKKPNASQMLVIFRKLAHKDLAYYAIKLFQKVGLTKDEFIKMYKKDTYTWLNILRLSTGSAFRPTENDIRKMNKKYKEIMLTQTLSHFTDDEAKFVLNHPGNKDDYSQSAYISKHIKKFSDKILFMSLLKSFESYRHNFGNFANTAIKITERLIKSEQSGLYTIVKHLYGDRHWGMHVLENKFLKFLQDDTLDTTLELLPKDALQTKMEIICKYYNINKDELNN